MKNGPLTPSPRVPKKGIMLDLFLSFAKIGMFTFGGGYAMLSLIESICVEKKQWITDNEMMDITVIAESTPGPIAINCATYVGYKKGKTIGAVVAMLGMILPSFIIIYLISLYLDRFLEIEWIAHAFYGIKIAVGILIVDAAVKLLKIIEKRPLPVTVVVCSSLAMLLISIFSLRISPMVLMLLAAGVGVIVFLITEKNGRGRTE